MNISSLNALIESIREKIPINRVFISKTKRDKKIEIIKDLCRENEIIYQMVPPQTINRKAGQKNQGVFAELSPVRFYTLNEILKNPKNGVLLILDRINDTGNLGAIIRTATAAEVDGILISQRNSAPINETVLKTSAGALLKARIVKSKNLVNDMNILKQNNYWIVGTVPASELAYYNYSFPSKTAIVMGNENRGISPLVKKNVDQLLSIPISSDVESLNVSVATAIILFEVFRQKKQ